MNALDELRKAKKFLERSGIENAVREAELILSYCLGIDRISIYKDNPLISSSDIFKIGEMLKRRAKREPLQYIIGYTEFYGLKIKVGQGALIPRPETELLAEEAIRIIRSLSKEGSRESTNILDLCTGSGCLALAIAKEFPDARVFATDISEIAIGYAKENAKLNGISNIIFLKGSLFEPIEKTRKFDLIISNPPYIKRNDIRNLQPEIKEWEPLSALDGGEDGLDYYRAIVSGSKSFLKENGILMFELGINEADAVVKIAEDAGFMKISLIKDYAGIERILILKRKISGKP